MTSLLDHREENRIDIDLGMLGGVKLDYENGVFRRSHVINNPLKYTDPTGQFWESFIGAIITIVVGWVADQLGAEVNTGAAVTVDSGGNVGVSPADPNAGIHVTPPPSSSSGGGKDNSDNSGVQNNNGGLSNSGSTTYSNNDSNSALFFGQYLLYANAGITVNDAGSGRRPLDFERLSFEFGSLVYLINDQGEKVRYYSGISGPFGRGKLPEGSYTGDNLRPRDAKGMVCDKFGWSLDLNPNFKTDRKHLRIHPDQLPKGTEGCIGVECKDSKRLYNDLKGYFNSGRKSIPVEVIW